MRGLPITSAGDFPVFKNTENPFNLLTRLKQLSRYLAVRDEGIEPPAYPTSRGRSTTELIAQILVNSTFF